LKDTKTPVWTAFAAFLLNVIFSLLLMKPLLHGGLALATTLSALVNMLLLLWFLRRKIGTFGGRGVFLSGVKALAASLPMGVAVFYSCRLADWSQYGHKLSKLLVLGCAIFIGLLIYAGAARLLRSDEVIAMSEIIRKKFGRRGV
jgi:putative peptidoglycan lipid II flippase